MMKTLFIVLLGLSLSATAYAQSDASTPDNDNTDNAAIKMNPQVGSDIGNSNIHTNANIVSGGVTPSSGIGGPNSPQSPVSTAIVVSPGITSKDFGFSTNILRDLPRDVADKMSGVQIISLDGKVTLRGRVANQADMSAIVSQIEGMTGVTAVENQLEVEG